MALLFSPIPIVNKLLTIVHGIVVKNGHVIEKYDRTRQNGDDVYYTECTVCKATVRVLCSAKNYNRSGTAFSVGCKPG